MATLDGVTVHMIREFLQDAGLSAQIESDLPDSGVIGSLAAQRKFLVFMYQPKGKGVFDSIQFWAGFRYTNESEGNLLKIANTWNKDKRFVSAYVFEDNAIHLEMDLLVQGVTPDCLRSYLGIWTYALSQF